MARTRGSGRPPRRWNDVVQDDMSVMGLEKGMASDRETYETVQPLPEWKTADSNPDCVCEILCKLMVTFRWYINVIWLNVIWLCNLSLVCGSFSTFHLKLSLRWTYLWQCNCFLVCKTFLWNGLVGSIRTRPNISLSQKRLIPLAISEPFHLQRVYVLNQSGLQICPSLFTCLCFVNGIVEV